MFGVLCPLLWTAGAIGHVYLAIEWKQAGFADDTRFLCSAQDCAIQPSLDARTERMKHRQQMAQYWHTIEAEVRVRKQEVQLFMKFFCKTMLPIKMANYTKAQN